MTAGTKGIPFVTPPVQLYDDAPEPFKVTLEPTHTVVEGKAIELTCGRGNKVIV